MPFPLVVMRHGTNIALRFASGLTNGRKMFLTTDVEVPDFDATYWVAGEVAARMLHAQIPLSLIAPGHTWIGTLDKSFTGRDIRFGVRADMPQGVLLHAKPAELKVPDLLATVYTAEDFISRAEEIGVHPDSRVQWTQDILDLDHEHRFFILEGVAATGSPYKVNSQIWHEGMVSDRTKEANAFVADVLSYLRDEDNLPPAFVLDVAFDHKSGSWIVIESNPAWGAGMYGVDLTAMISTLDRACHAEPGDERWAWSPDVEMMRRAQEEPLMRMVNPEDSFSIVEYAG